MEREHNRQMRRIRRERGSQPSLPNDEAGESTPDIAFSRYFRGVQETEDTG